MERSLWLSGWCLKISAIVYICEYLGRVLRYWPTVKIARVDVVVEHTMMFLEFTRQQQRGRRSRGGYTHEYKAERVDEQYQ
jgi:hypothetical protein